jgi:hypothetical protein
MEPAKNTPAAGSATPGQGTPPPEPDLDPLAQLEERRRRFAEEVIQQARQLMQPPDDSPPVADKVVPSADTAVRPPSADTQVPLPPPAPLVAPVAPPAAPDPAVPPMHADPLRIAQQNQKQAPAAAPAPNPAAGGQPAAKGAFLSKGATPAPARPRAAEPRPGTVPPGPVLPPAPAAATWKVLEPEDPSDPVAHEVCELRRRDADWNVLAASIRGKLHAHKAMWRDDAYAFDWVGDWTIIALSDGAGSARLARIGARAACDAALRTMKETLAGYRPAPGPAEAPLPADQDRLREALIHGALQARAGIMLEAQKRQCPSRDLHATFLLVIHTPFKENTLVGAIQVGDGAIGVYTEDDVCRLLGVADHGQYSSETCFLTTPHIEEQFAQRVRFSIFKKAMRGLAVMCDGVSDDFFPEDKRLIELFSGNPIQELKTKQGAPVWGLMHRDRGVVRNPEAGKALLEWLQYEKRGSSDDRTLVLMYRNV